MSDDRVILEVKLTGDEPLIQFISAIMDLVNHDAFEVLPGFSKRAAMQYLVDSVIGDSK